VEVSSRDDSFFDEVAPKEEKQEKLVTKEKTPPVAPKEKESVYRVDDKVVKRNK
jgi:hypothetical protein